ncbi:hypothetical protein [Tenacibaculum singaporense]|uniref:hypothetical protein n=1 Tax=Tenacibaculum singaporense TaxID=2358479 RepID=UPI000F66D533|nr:hypothetical protein [Tenacibaculum singaporense]RSC96071.1 hypothetical protein EI424_02820 [Tenacibaculum singaporense]
MIVFYGDNFELNLTDTKITLNEENPLFYNYFVKNYSWPFSKKVDDETSKKLGFLDLENSANYKTKIYGKLLLDNSFDVAYLILTDYHNGILQGAIYYGEVAIELLDKPLKDLSFPVVKTTTLIAHAKEVIAKSYPEVNYNFPMVIDDNFSSNSKYEKFEGIINNYVNDNFVTNSNQTVEGEIVAFNKNVMTPFPYLMGILKAGFDSVNMVMQGSFVSDKVNEKILLFTDKHLEKFYSGLPDGFQFTTTGEVWENGVVTADFVKYYAISQQGSYKVQLYLNIPPELKVIEYTVKHNTNVVFASKSNTINEAIIINVKSDEDLGNFIFTLKLRKFTSNPSDGIGNIENYNNVDFSFSDGQLNIFPTSFSLSEVMPDMTFGKFLNKIKNWLNLEITFDNNLVSLNYIEDKFLDVEFKDERHLEIPKPYRTFNQNKLYKLVTSNTNLTIGNSGVVTTTEGFREEDITTIDMGLEVMPVQAKDAVFTAYKNEDTNDFKLFLYDGLQSGLPVAVESVADRNYSLNEVYNRYWKNWLFFRLNSETYKDKFKVHFLEQFNKSMGRMKYNKKHLYKKIKKRRVDENEWEYEIESETLP